MNVYHYSSITGEYIGESVADESPLEPGVFLIPANATTLAPLPTADGKTVNFSGSAWVYRDIPPPIEKTYAEKRAAEYPAMTDYLDGVVKGDQAQIDAYIATCQAVKAKYPKP